jgi:hypothetical protein
MCSALFPEATSPSAGATGRPAASRAGRGSTRRGRSERLAGRDGGHIQPAGRGDRACIGVGVEPCRSYPVNSPGLADKSASATIAGGLLAIPVAVFSPMGRFAGWLRPRSGVGHSERSRIIDHGITCREALFSGQTRVGPQGDPPEFADRIRSVDPSGGNGAPGAYRRKPGERPSFSGTVGRARHSVVLPGPPGWRRVSYTSSTNRVQRGMRSSREDLRRSRPRSLR